jgi:hypothetical protein
MSWIASRRVQMTMHDRKTPNNGYNTRGNSHDDLPQHTKDHHQDPIRHQSLAMVMFTSKHSTPNFIPHQIFRRFNLSRRRFEVSQTKHFCIVWVYAFFGRKGGAPVQVHVIGDEHLWPGRQVWGFPVLFPHGATFPGRCSRALRGVSVA